MDLSQIIRAKRIGVPLTNPKVHGDVDARVWVASSMLRQTLLPEKSQYVLILKEIEWISELLWIDGVKIILILKSAYHRCPG